VRRVLQRLRDQGIIDSQDAGNATLYRLNRQHLAAPWIVGLANLRQQLVERLTRELQSWSPPPVFAALFGSAAAGTMSERSDIDILVIRPSGADGREWEEPIEALERAVSGWTGNDGRVLQLSQSAVGNTEIREPVLEDVFEAGIPLIGDLDWLARRLHLARRSHR
jgi:predicted nucleotidyltransferase